MLTGRRLQRVAEAGAIPHLVALLKVNDSFAQSQVKDARAHTVIGRTLGTVGHIGLQWNVETPRRR